MAVRSQEPKQQVPETVVLATTRASMPTARSAKREGIFIGTAPSVTCRAPEGRHPALAGSKLIGPAEECGPNSRRAREQIMNGSDRMPAWKYKFKPAEIDDLIPI